MRDATTDRRGYLDGWQYDPAQTATAGTSLRRRPFWAFWRRG
jgi:hypothetical protein